MKHALVNSPLAEIEADAIIVGVCEGGNSTSFCDEIDAATGKVISQLFEQEEITGKANEVTILLAPTGVKAKQIALVGLGSVGKSTQLTAFQAAGAASKALSKKPRERVAFLLDDNWDDSLKSAAIAGAMFGCVGQDLYRAKKSTHPISNALWPASYESSISEGTILGESVNLTRRLVNEPPHALYPESFAEHATEMANEAGLEIEVWDDKRLEEEGCGALLAVGRSSSKPSRLAIMRHQGAPKNNATLALVGKGVTFDSGGLSLKPSDGMKTMKADMAGAGAVVGAMNAIAKLKVPANVIGIIGMVENMPSQAAYKLGDVLTARNGTTIEVHNTDAEGRLVLADALCVAVENEATKIVDLATLTGACVVALGENICGLMTNDEPFSNQVKAAAERTGESVWELPMAAEFGEQIQSKVADIMNTGGTRWGGAITAAKLLEHFVDERPWVHLDIAGPCFYESPKAWADAGASGVMVRTLLELARDFADDPS